MGKAQIEARVPGGIWGDNDTFGVPGGVVDYVALEGSLLLPGLIIKALGGWLRGGRVGLLYLLQNE